MKTIIKKAETFRRSLKFTNKRTGGTVDLTGCTAYSQMRDVPGGTVLATAECTIVPTDGTVNVLFDKTVTADLPLGDAGYDVWLVCDDEQKPIFTEEVTIIDSYTEVEDGA